MKVKNISGGKIVISELALELQEDQEVRIREDGRHKVNGVEVDDITIAIRYAEAGKLKITEEAQPPKSEEILSKILSEINSLKSSQNEIISTLNTLIEVSNSLTKLVKNSVATSAVAADTAKTK